jgi:hypothetical protein
MPVIDLTPALPAVGIHFGMDEDTYHELPCCSNSHILNILSSPTIFWAESWMNPVKVKDRREKVSTDKTHNIVGRAYHAMILEGREAYEARYYVAPDPKEYPGALRNVDEIKQAIEKCDAKPVSKVDVPGEEGKTRTAKKEDWAAQLARLDRSVPVWDNILARAEKLAKGRPMVDVETDTMIRIAAHMIAQDPMLQKAFRGGYPEVTLIWRDPRCGVLMKARVDYMKFRVLVDLKSFQNSRGRSVRKAIIKSISDNHYALQPAVYLEGAQEVRGLIRKHGASAIHWHGPDDSEAAGAAQEFAMKWATVEQPDEWLWVFQQKGDAPVTRGLYHPLGSTYHSIARQMVADGLRKFRDLSAVYGTDRWLDLADIDRLDEEELPLWGLEI